jgi:hypothetical protein
MVVNLGSKGNIVPRHVNQINGDKTVHLHVGSAQQHAIQRMERAHPHASLAIKPQCVVNVRQVTLGQTVRKHVEVARGKCFVLRVMVCAH